MNASEGAHNAETVRLCQRPVPERLRYLADKITDAAERYAISEVKNHAFVLRVLADELAHIDGQVRP